ncbi:MAG: nucleotidyltransferase family protein [Acidobacteria bacterium]|nr:nucleotidyltransferase family protein [Acidobacteriota bacterium]
MVAGDTEAVLARAAVLGLFPLACHRLRQAGAGLGPEWEELFRANAARNLYLHHEQARLLTELASARVCAAPLKGTSLAELAYGDLALRAQVDLDLYIAPGDLPAALDCLNGAGYRPAVPSAVPASLLARTGDEFTSECQLASTGGGMPVLLELHWRILPLSDRKLRSALASQTPPRLPHELNLLYLCLKAATQRWGSLKLLCDLAHWLERRPPDWEGLVSLAGRLGLRRIVCLTLDALGAYFGTQTPKSVAEALASARPESFPVAAVANPFVPVPVLSASAHHRLRLALRERYRDRARYVARLLRPTASDLAALRLPRSLGFLYWGVRWLRLTGLLKNGWKRESQSLGTAHP